MKFYQISVDPYDGGPTIYAAAKSQIAAKKAAKKDSRDSGWRPRHLDLIEIDQADMPKNAQRWVFGS